MDCNDVWMVQARYDLGFALEPRPIVCSCVCASLHHLECNGAVQSQVPRLVDDAHPAATQHGFDVVAGDMGRT